MSESANSVASTAKAAVAPDGGPRGGEWLRRHREARGLSVADVAGSLKVGVRRVEAIEAGEWIGLLPAPYLRGFVRAYAKLVQVDPAPVLADIERSLGVSQGRLPDAIEPPNHLEQPFVERSSGRLIGNSPRRYRWVGVVAAAVLAALLLAFVSVRFPEYTRWVRVGWPAGPVTNESTTESIPLPSPIAPAESKGGDAGPHSSALSASTSNTDQLVGAGQTASASRGAALRDLPDMASPSAPQLMTQTGSIVAAAGNQTAFLTVHVERDSWVELRQTDGTLLVSQLMAAGSERVILGSAPINFVIGNPQGVKLIHRGREVELTPYISKTVARGTLR